MAKLDREGYNNKDCISRMLKKLIKTVFSWDTSCKYFSRFNLRSSISVSLSVNSFLGGNCGISEPNSLRSSK